MTRERRGVRTLLAAAFAGVALSCAACSGAFDSVMQSNEKPVEPNIVPADFKNQILSNAPSIILDPNNIRDAYYSDPVLDPKSGVSVYWSCVRMNARDGTRQYSGPKDYVVYYYGGRISQFVLATTDQCRVVNYKPFPELEKLCPSGKCS